jgi:uncharacterized protein (TIGR02117 family)
VTARSRSRARRLATCTAAAITGVAVVVALYFLAALACGLIPVNRAYKPATDGIDVTISSNGVHVDLVVPLKAGGIDWAARLPIGALGFAPGETANLAIGWGDRGFYLATPTWADLQVSTALRAVTGAGASVMHVEATGAPTGPNTRHVVLSVAQYALLAQYIEGSFQHDETGAVIVVPGAHYGWHDAFFEATGHYSAFKTCNEWSRQGLAVAGVRVPLWSPFASALLYQLPAGD